MTSDYMAGQVLLIVMGCQDLLVHKVPGKFFMKDVGFIFILDSLGQGLASTLYKGLCSLFGNPPTLPLAQL